MHPVLLSIGSLSISSFGFFLTLGFLLAAFVVWRLAKTYDLHEEKVLDLAILSFFGGILGGRIYFVVFNWPIFGSLEKALLLNRYPGLAFWGAVLGGALALWFFAKRLKLPFWQIGDFAAVGFLIGVSLGNIGCFLGGCNFGYSSNLPFAVSQVGVVGKRLPLSLMEAVIFALAAYRLFQGAVRFHFGGKILSSALILLGIVKFITQFWRDENAPQSFGLAGTLVISGIAVYYIRSKRSFLQDLKMAGGIITSGKRRQITLATARKSWYNFMIGWKVRLSKLYKFLSKAPRLLRKLNVKPTPRDIIED